MLVVLGLGNPGQAYISSRHNVGFWCVDTLSSRHGIALAERRRYVVLGEGSIFGEHVVLAKPRTYMNSSGIAARYLLDRLHIVPSGLLVVYDDMDLPTGTLRIRAQGGSAGHNGVNSIVAQLGTQQFARLRVGVGRPEIQEAIPYVLEPFDHEEIQIMQDAIDRAAEAVCWVAQYGLDSAMNRYN